MKISEIVQKKPPAHHSVMHTITVGPWQVQLDTHALASRVDPQRSVPQHVFVNIMNSACNTPGTLDTIPIGRGAFFQDTTTRVSLYFKRLDQHTLRLETVLGAGQQPKPPLFRRPVTPWQPPPRIVQQQQAIDQQLAQQVQQRGRDSLSQDLEQAKPYLDTYNSMNRQDRRAFDRMINKQKKKLYE